MTVGADCVGVLGVVYGGPFQGELHCGCFIRKRLGERRATKMIPVEDGRAGRVATITSVPPFSRNISVDLVSLSVFSGSYCTSPIIGPIALYTHYPIVWTVKNSVFGTRVLAVL